MTDREYAETQFQILGKINPFEIAKREALKTSGIKYILPFVCLIGACPVGNSGSVSCWIRQGVLCILSVRMTSRCKRKS